MSSRQLGGFSPWLQGRVAGIGALLVAAMSGFFLFFLYRSIGLPLLLPGGDNNNKNIEKKNKSVEVGKTKAATATAPPSQSKNNEEQKNDPLKDATAKIHSRIEEIDKRGKVLFKAKKFMEAADVFTEALDLIQSFQSEHHSTTTSSSSSSYILSLSKQVVTLTNNRSAMYEKGGEPDLALVDCESILQMDPTHNKARSRRLRILESKKQYLDSLVEVCALQLLFMRDNREKLRMGLQVTPPVPQSKIEDLMNRILPTEIQKYLAKVEAKPLSERSLPHANTILQLLQSFGGYNAWMAAAAKGGSVSVLTTQLDALNDDNNNNNDKEEDNDKKDKKEEEEEEEDKKMSPARMTAQKATLLMRRGQRHMYDRNYDKAKNDFDFAYDLVENNNNKSNSFKEEVIDLMQNKDNDNDDDDIDNAYTRLLEWSGMVRHLRYDFNGAIKCYEKCSDFEPTNAELLVKRAGVKMDQGDQKTAHSLFETALGLDPDAMDALLHRANLKMHEQKPLEAEEDLRQCLKLRPNNVVAQLRLATVLMTRKELDEAKSILDDVLERNETVSGEAHLYLGEIYMARGNIEDAMEEFKQTMESDPNNPTGYVNMALAILNMGSSPGPGAGAGVGGLPDVAEAIRLLEKAIEVDPQFHAAYVHLGQLKLSMATDLATARKVVSLYDRGLEHCRTAEELKDVVSMRILTVAQVDAATDLKMETLHVF